MAYDGVGITEGVGKILATDKVNFGNGLVHTQIIKISGGANETNLAKVDSNGSLQVDVAGLRAGLLSTGADIPSGAATNPISTPLTGRRSVMIYNNSDVPIFFGGSGVTTTTGIPIPSGQAMPLDIGTIPFFLVHGAAVAKNVRILEVA